MLSTGIPELQTVDDISYLRDAFASDKSDDAAAEEFSKFIEEALKAKSVLFNEMVHLIAHSKK
jgi:phosphatidylinositol-4,5-bisphosphate 3-kinase